MLYIEKKAASRETASEISRVKRDCQWDHMMKDDPEMARETFNQLDKAVIRRQLYMEQKSLCAYCMRKLPTPDEEETGKAFPSVIGHWMPVAADPSDALEYKNMLLCCDGGSRSRETPHAFAAMRRRGRKSSN